MYAVFFILCHNFHYVFRQFPLSINKPNSSCLRTACPLLVTKILPLTIRCFWQYCVRYSISDCGSRITRCFPLQSITTSPCASDSAVIYESSLIRMPVLAIVCKIAQRRSSPRPRAALTNFW